MPGDRKEAATRHRPTSWPPEPTGKKTNAKRAPVVCAKAKVTAEDVTVSAAIDAGPTAAGVLASTTASTANDAGDPPATASLLSHISNAVLRSLLQVHTTVDNCSTPSVEVPEEPINTTDVYEDLQLSSESSDGDDGDRQINQTENYFGISIFNRDQNYMARYGSYCTRGSQPTFETFARIHNGGPAEGCRYSWTIKYWNHVRQCLN